MIRCTTCLIPDTRPDTAFEDGQCSACRNFAKRAEIDWPERKAELVRILETAPRNGSGYDCIVPSSGGKDSTYQVLTLIELGARPLVVTATTCMPTKIGKANIANLARFATTIEVTPNREVRRKLNRLGLELVGDVSWPEHVSIFTTPFRLACDLGIPTLFYGESPQREYGCPAGAEEARTMTRRWIAEFGGFLGLRPADLVGQESLTEADMADYELPSDDRLAGVTAYFLGQFVPWDSRHNALVARAAGMREHGQAPSSANWWHFENLDCALTGMHDHAMYRKYGYGRAAAQLSIDIRNGVISRDKALAVARERDGLFPDEYMGVRLRAILDHLYMTKAEVIAHLDRFTNWDLFSHVENGRPVLKAAA